MEGSGSMAETANLALPLVQASQAQKHVTVNEAMVRLDAVSQLVLASTGLDTPPADPAEGACFAVAPGATDDWAGRDGQVAVADNGGWAFLAPAAGWRAWDASAGRPLVHDGTGWRATGFAQGASGAGARFVTEEAVHTVAPGPENTLAVSIPARVTLFAVSARVTSEITGAATTWRLGEAGATDRFGSGLGLAEGSYADGLLGQPQAYYAASPLVMRGEGGDLAGGEIRVALHYLAYALPGV
jgi:hypothetical protein